MRDFLRRLRSSLRELPYRYDREADGDEYWTPEDTMTLVQFLGTGTGIKLKSRLLNYTIRCSMQSTDHPNNHGYHAGLAKGVKLGVAAIQEHALSASLPRNEGTPDEQTDGAESDTIALN